MTSCPAPTSVDSLIVDQTLLPRCLTRKRPLKPPKRRYQKSQTFESNTMSSTSSYSSCSSSISTLSQHKQLINGRLSSLKNNANNNTNNSSSNSCESREIGNDLLAPSQNYLNEIGIEKQYSIELRWNNGSKEEIPASMIHQQEHHDDESIYDSVGPGAGPQSHAPKDLNHLHPPTLSKRVNIFSDASPFAAFTQHSVMSDLYGEHSTNHQNIPTKKSAPLATDSSDLDDGFESLSSNSTYPANLSTTNSELSTKCSFAGEASNLLEMDHGSNYYRTHFRDFEHQNWLQIHEKYGPIVVSLRKERLKSSSSSSSGSSQSGIRWRVILRTTSLIPLRGTICSLPNICNITSTSGSSASLDSKSKSSGDNFNLSSAKDVLSLIMPKTVNINNFRLSASTAVSHLLKLDELSQNTEYKIGILYAYGNQHSEEEFYNNILEYSNSSKSLFYDFLNLISSRVRLKNFKGYKAGLDVHKDTTGEYSWTSRFSHVDIMFHVCTELPYTETNRQQLSRKRHIGNDIVTIIFLDEDFVGEPFTPSLIRSKFQQVFIIVKPINGGQYYRVAVARHKLVPLFGPPLKAYYSRAEIKDLILTKIINAENACHSVNKFAEMAKRTRNEYLVDLCNKHSTNQTTSQFDSSSSSMNSLNSIKKLFGSSSSSSNGSGSGSIDASKKSKLGSNHELSLAAGEGPLGAVRHPHSGLVPPFSRSHILNGVKDAPTLLGGVLFTERCAGSSIPSRLYVHDFSTSRDIEASLLISNEAIMVIDANNSQVIWAAPVTSIIGWTDSSGVFASSPTTLPEKFSQINGHASSRLTGMRAKSMDAETVASHGANNGACRELRLYYHQGECIQIMQRPVLGGAAPEQVHHAPIISGKSKQSGGAAVPPNTRNDDPFLQLIRLLELVTRKSELREIVIKRKTSPIHKPTFANTSSHQQSKALSFDPPGRCGGQFGYCMDMSTGIIEDVFDQTLTGFQLSTGCKVLEVAKISFLGHGTDELQDLLNASVIISLTCTEYDFFRYQPRCSCAWPQALQIQQKQKSQMTPPSEYDNVSNTVKKNPPGVKSIHITHAAHPSDDFANRNGLLAGKHNPLVSMSSTSSTSSHYSTAAGSSNPATPPQSNYHQLYNAKSTSNLAQFSVGGVVNRSSESPTKGSASGMNSSLNPSMGTLSRAKSTTLSGPSSSSNFKDNLIRLITMDDCVPSSNPSSPSINGDSCFEQFVDPNKVKTSTMSSSSSYSSNNCSSLQQQATTNSLRSNQSKASSYMVDEQASNANNAFASYPSSRYSTASSAQYSSLGRNGSTSNYSSIPTSGCSTQIHLAANSGGSSGASSIRPAQSSGNILNASQQAGNEQQSNENCYVLTAQPIRVDPQALTLQQQQQQQQQQNLMTTSLDSSMFHSLMSGTSGSTSDTIGDIVWPSMASDTPPSSLMSSSAIRNNLANNEIIVTGQELNDTSAGQAAIHLTDEVRKLSLEKDVLTDTIYKLQEENQRLHMESQNASHQLRKLTEWFFNSGNSSPISNSSSTANSASQSTCGGNQSQSTTVSLQTTGSNATHQHKP